MNERVSSVLVKGLNYDFEFNENTLNKQDMSLETDIHTIKVFGNDYLIGMGGVMKHPDNDELSYFIAYLIYNKKVVCKLGIYEILNEKEDLDHRSVDFSSLRLIVDNRYYEEPNILESYISTIEDVENANVNAVADAKDDDADADADDDAGAEDDVDAEDDAENDVNAGAEETKSDNPEKVRYKNDSHEFVPFLKDLFINMTTFENYKSSSLRNLMVMYRKSILTLLNSSEMKKKRKEIYVLFQKMYPPGTSTDFNPSSIINDEDDGGNEKVFLSKQFNPHILLVAEYYLNVKVIVNNVDSFSIYGSLNNTESIASVEKAKENVLFSTFNPESILYLNVEDGLITSTVLKTLNNLNDEEIQKLKELMDKNDHEFVFESQLQSIKQLVS